MVGLVGAIWGIVGMMLVMANAVYRLSGIARDALSYDLSWYHWFALVVNLAFMIYSEAYKGFHKSFSPRLAARAKHLRDHPRLLHVCLAPLFCAGYFHTNARRKKIVTTLTLGIVVLILIVHRFPQPWRGIVDAGVVAGLALGLVSIAHQGVLAFFTANFQASPELPD